MVICYSGSKKLTPTPAEDRRHPQGGEVRWVCRNQKQKRVWVRLGGDHIDQAPGCGGDLPSVRLKEGAGPGTWSRQPSCGWGLGPLEEGMRPTQGHQGGEVPWLPSPPPSLPLAEPNQKPERGSPVGGSPKPPGAQSRLGVGGVSREWTRRGPCEIFLRKKWGMWF